MNQAWRPLHYAGNCIAALGPVIALVSAVAGIMMMR